MCRRVSTAQGLLASGWGQERVLAPLPAPSRVPKFCQGTSGSSIFLCVCDAFWRREVVFPVPGALPSPWLGQLPEGPAPRIRLPSRRAEPANICLLGSAEFLLVNPPPVPQRSPKPPAPVPAEPGVSRALGLVAVSRGRARAPETAPGLGGRSGCAGRRLNRASPFPRAAPALDARSRGLLQQSAAEGRALRAACCAARNPRVAGEPAGWARDPGEAGRTDLLLPASRRGHRPAPSGFGAPGRAGAERGGAALCRPRAAGRGGLQPGAGA